MDSLREILLWTATPALLTYIVYNLIKAIKKDGIRPYAICFVSWLFPGAGHVIQKKRAKGLIFFAGIVLLLAMGIIMEGKFYATSPFHPLLLLGFLGDLGNGIFFFIIKAFNLGTGNIKALTFHYGTAYLAAAGLLNYLIALNAFDLAKGRRK